MPCGYGRHTIELIIRGYVPKGIDINAIHIAEAEKRLYLEAKKRNKNPHFEPTCWGYFGMGDMRDMIDQREVYHAIINMFYSFGFFETDKENEQVMDEFFKSLKPHGQLLLHTDVSPEILASGRYKFEEVRNLTSEKKLYILEEYNSQTKRMNGSWSIIQTDGKEERLTPYSVRIYSREEFEDMAKNIGFRETKFYGSFEGEEFSKDSKELIMVARK